MLQRTLFVLLTLLTLGVVACENIGPSTDTLKAEDVGNILRYDVNFPIGILFPPEALSSGASHAFPLLYSYLFVPDDKGKLLPDLAEKWTYDPQNRTWTIRLRKDVRFHNGWPVTAKDIIYSWKLFTSVFSGFSSIVKSIEVLSEQEIALRLTEDAPDFLDRIWDMEILPFPRGDKVDYFNHPVGSGPFQFVSRNAEKEVVLKANSSYFGGRPTIDKVVFKYIPDKERSWTRLLAGETDVVQEIAPNNLEIMKNLRGKFYISKYTLSYYTILLFNTRNSFFSNVRIRRAIAHSIDSNYIVNNILHGFGKVAVGPLGVDVPLQSLNVHPPEYDPENTLRLLAESGWLPDNKTRFLKKQGQVFEFTLLVPAESRIKKQVAQYIQLCLNEIGLKVHLVSLPSDDIYVRYKGNNQFQAVLTEFDSAHRRPEDLHQIWCNESDKASIDSGFFHPSVFRLCKQILNEKDPQENKQIFYRLNEIIISLQPGVFLYHKSAIDVMSRRILLSVPFSLDHQGIYRLRHAIIK
ncbi:MAG: ABC transporter substrate-binding protein [Desulfobacterales bacterium]